MDCQDVVYSEEYQDYIVEYGGFEQLLEDSYAQNCYQVLSNRFAVVYLRSDEVVANQRNNLLTIPRCFGLLSSAQTLEVTGVNRVRRQSGLSLYGNEVLVGIIDTGAGVKENLRNHIFTFLRDCDIL